MTYDFFQDDNLEDDSQTLAERLDHVLPPGSAMIDDPSLFPGEYEDDPLVEVARIMARGPHPALPNVALDRIEARLRTRHAALFAQPAAPVRRRNGRPRWQTTLYGLRRMAAVLLVVLMFTSSLSVMSANALPGDNLYQVKTVVEELRLLTVSAEGEPGVRVEMAERRLDEFEQLIVERGTVYPEVLLESSAQLNRALTLLSEGHGDRVELDPRIANISYRQATLIQSALPLASPEAFASLSLVSDWNNLLIARVLTEGSIDYTGSVVSSVHKTNFMARESGGTVPPTVTPEPEDMTPEPQSKLPALVVVIADC